MNETSVLINFAIAVALGALVGLERERHFDEEDRSTFAGVRTFAIVCLTGAVCGFLINVIGPWVAVAGLLAVSAFSIASFFASIKDCEQSIGITTEMAFVFTYLVGLILNVHVTLLGQSINGRGLGIALGIGMTAILSLKTETRRISSRIQRRDIAATLKFCIISLVILPFLPRDTFDPWNVLSLYNVWLMVVLVSGISFIGYVAAKLLGGNRGLGITALLGGLWSSTATTMTFANRCKQNPESFNSYALAVLIACSTMFPRQIVEVYLVGPSMIIPVLLPLGLMGLFGLTVSLVWYYKAMRNKETSVEMTNPFSLSPALKFAALYSVVLVVSKVAGEQFGSAGVYAAALLSGLVDVNAITLSVANLVAQKEMEVGVGVTAVVMAGISNTIVKAGITLLFGTGKMFKTVVPWFVAMLILGAAAIVAQVYL